MKRKNTLFTWQLPINQWESGVINCSRELGGCGRKHSFNLESSGEIAFDCSWENSKGQFECEKFADWLEEEAREEWAEEIRQEYCKLVVAEEAPPLVVPEQVSIKEKQWEKEFGAIRPVGFYRQRKGVFICGQCSAEVPGAGRHSQARNRNNPCFWGLTVEEKVLCLGCIMRHHYEKIGNWRKRGKLKEYVKRGYKVGGVV